MKQRIRLTESVLHRIIKESVKRILKEGRNYVPNYHAPLNRFAVVPKGGSNDDAMFFDFYEDAIKAFGDGMDMYCSQDGGRTWDRC